MDGYHKHSDSERRAISQREIVEAVASAAAAQATAAVMAQMEGHDCLSSELRAWIVRSIEAEKRAAEEKAQRIENREYWIKSITGLSAALTILTILFHGLGRLGIWLFDFLISQGRS